MTKDSTTPALMVLKGPIKEKLFALETNLVTVGRGEEADICLTGDTAISRVHLNLRLVNGRYVLASVGENGTLLNDKVTETRQLQNGDRIRLGELYTLEYSDGSKAVKAPGKSMFAKPGVLVACGVYVLAMISVAVYLSSASGAADTAVNSASLTAALTSYRRYLNVAKVTPSEQEARQRSIRGYLRAGFIAEREGNYPEARRIYLKVMDYAQDGQSPIYQYALDRLRTVPVPEK